MDEDNSRVACGADPGPPNATQEDQPRSSAPAATRAVAASRRVVRVAELTD